MELLAVLPDFNGGGAQRVTLTLMNELARRGRRIHISVLRRAGPLEALLDPGIVLDDLGRTRLRSAILPLLSQVRALQPRFVFSTLGYINIALLLVKPLLPSATRLWIREANLPSISLPGNKYSRLIRLGYAFLYPRADLVVCSSERMRSEFLSDFGLAGSRLRLLANPVDEDQVRRSAATPQRDAGNGVRFVAAGRLTAQKGFDRLIEMFARTGDPDSRLAIIGEGPLAADLSALAKRLGVAERVEFPGFRDNPWRHVAGADAFLLPSRWEGMPNAALEALACGVPVIATPESGGIAEIAAAAPAGAVTVVEAGPPYVAAMRQVVPGFRGTLRTSLLPPGYRLGTVVDTFERWLDHDA